MRGAVILAALALAACQPAPELESAEPETIAITVGPISSAKELEGIYRVAELADIDMADLDRGVSVMIEKGRIDVLLQCVNTHWQFHFEGERLVTKSVQDHEVCRRALNPEEAAIMDAFDQADRVSRTESNGIRFEGSGGNVTLFLQ